MQTVLSLKKGKEKPLLQRHHWIYSGAVESFPNEGDIAEVRTSTGEKLGLALLNQGHSIAAHMIAFGGESLEEALRSRILSAAALRKSVFDPKQTNAIRLINAEGDGIPGLILDAYNDVFVLQISHPALDRIKIQIISLIHEIFRPRSLYEKSTSFLRKKGGMKEAKALLFGEEAPFVEVLENGLKFSVDVVNGQKTGLFLDQREMRSLVRSLAPNRTVLNGFAYTGGFSVAALAGGAKHVDSVEISMKCKEPIEKNLELNGLSNHAHITADMFDFLKTSDLCYDLVILDPPAFVKKREDVKKAFFAYKDLNRSAMEKMPSGSLLLTCSCSYHIEEALFQNILFRAALESKRSVRILSRHRQALDHPISLFHPESSYLKSFLLYLD
jgi:23S rRNA (cytosine1962-C5)-methyltransferase